MPEAQGLSVGTINVSQAVRQALRAASAHFLTLCGPAWSGFILETIPILRLKIRLKDISFPLPPRVRRSFAWWWPVWYH